jgi:hypothetical protein
MVIAYRHPRNGQFQTAQTNLMIEIIEILIIYRVANGRSDDHPVISTALIAGH